VNGGFERSSWFLVTMEDLKGIEDLKGVLGFW
jgi:hypothetical protein